MPGSSPLEVKGQSVSLEFPQIPLLGKLDPAAMTVRPNAMTIRLLRRCMLSGMKTSICSGLLLTGILSWAARPAPAEDMKLRGPGCAASKHGAGGGYLSLRTEHRDAGGFSRYRRWRQPIERELQTHARTDWKPEAGDQLWRLEGFGCLCGGQAGDGGAVADSTYGVRRLVTLVPFSVGQLDDHDVVKEIRESSSGGQTAACIEFETVAARTRPPTRSV